MAYPTRIAAACCFVTLIAGCERPLTGSEISFASQFLGQAVIYDEVRVQPSAINTRTQRPATAIGNTITWNRETFRPNFIPPPPDITFTEDQMLLVHELVHVWQYQNADSTGYSFDAVIREHLDHDDPYDYPTPLDPSRDLLDYRFEQQAKIVEDWVRFTLHQDQRAAIYRRVVERTLSRDIFETIQAVSDPARLDTPRH